MVTEDTSGQRLENPEQPTPESLPAQGSEETPKEFRLSIRIEEEARERMTAVANYAADEGVIPQNPKGNLTAWVNYCLQLGEEMMKQHAYQARGIQLTIESVNKYLQVRR